MPFKIVRNDITGMKVDAIVNTTNEGVTYGDGIDIAVYLSGFGSIRKTDCTKRIEIVYVKIRFTIVKISVILCIEQ